MTRAAPSITLDGGPIPSVLARASIALNVRQTLDAPAVAEMTFADLSEETLGIFRVGQSTTVSVDPGGILFEGDVTTIEHEYSLAEGRITRIRAHDRLHRLRKRQRPRVLSDAGLEELLAEAAADLGVELLAPSGMGRRELLIQHEQSDLQLLTEFAAASGLYLALRNGRLHLFSLAGTGEETLSLEAGRELLQARITTSAESMRRSTAVHAWDPSRMTAWTGNSGLARQEAEASRSDGLGAFPGLGDRTLFNRLGADAAEVEDLAQADIDHAVGRESVLEAVAEGDARLFPGRRLRVSGVGGGDSRHVVCTATHGFDAVGGYVTTLASEPPARPARVGTPAVTIGSVASADDPERLSRVRVDLPGFGGLRSGWLAVLAAGAGADKGVAVMPETGDDVLVLFPDGDPSRGLVLGGLFGARPSPGLQTSPGPRGFTVRTPGGQKLVLDSVDPAARLETRSGDLLEFGPAGSRLSVTQDLVIEAPGRRLTIRAASVDFERA